MSRTRKLHEVTASGAMKALTDQLGAGKPRPKQKPEWLPLRSIKQHPQVFQHRRPAKHASEAHIKVLMSALNGGGLLEPVTVWWDGKAWACVDGHHRLAAYSRSDKVPASLPVKVFEGTLEEALILAARANTKDKLPMSRAEKSNTAWRLVLSTSASKAALAESSGASESTVAHMRRVREKLTAAGHPIGELQDLTWDAARRLSVGQEAPDWDPEEEERRAEKFAKKLHEVFGVQGAKQPDIFLRAIELYSSTLLARIEEDIRERLREEAEEEAA